MRMTIREATIADREAVGSIFSDESQYHHELQPSVFNRLSAQEILPTDWFEEILGDDTRHLIIAEIDNEPVGAMLFTVRQADDDPLVKEKKWIYVDEMSVLSGSRGAGVGKGLLKHLEEYASRTGAGSIRLEVWENNGQALAFYGKNEFEIRKHVLWKDVPKPEN